MLTENTKIVAVWRGDSSDLPAFPVVLEALSRRGFDIVWLCGTAGTGACNRLRGGGIEARPLNVPSTGYEAWPAKFTGALEFRKRAWRYIESLGSKPILWIVNAETAIVMGRRLFDFQYVLHAFELPEANAKRVLARSYFKQAKTVITPGEGRAEILRNWYGLPAAPIELPNVPAIEDRSPRQPIGDTIIADCIGTGAASRRIVLYQGMIAPERDLTVLARVLADRQQEWAFVVMGRDYGHLPTLRRAHPNLLYVPHIPAPNHLRVTSWANIGVVAYTQPSLNNRFCAPNKIYEYGAFGLPMLYNNIPGLVETVGRRRAGACCDFASEAELRRALDAIAGSYHEYSAGARTLYVQGRARLAELDRVVETVAGLDARHVCL